MTAADLAIVAALVFGWGTFSARLERLDVTAPIAFVLVGLLLTHGPLAVLGVTPSNELIKDLAEITLALVLFSDASRVGLRELRAQTGLYVRLLGVALPLTIGLGTLLALALGTGDGWLALLVGAALAPTDAALGAGMISNPVIPAGLRRLINVESGLNDGIATPFVSLAVAGAGGLLVQAAGRRGWTAEGFAGAAVLGLAVCAYATALAVDGNGFIAAFVGGLAYGAASGRSGQPLVPFVEETGALVSLLVWLAFGAVAVAPAVTGLTWQIALYAVLSLTLIRMLPVAVSLIGAGLDRPTIALIGWFGPRGLASVVFALLALEELGSHAAGHAVAFITITVILSVIAHGATADPLAARYARLVAGPSAGHPGADLTAAPRLPERRLVRRKRP